MTTTTAQSGQERAKEVHVNTETFVCQNCGGIMKFDIKKQAFACSACRTEYDLETLSDTVRENDFSLYLEREKATVPFEGMAVVACQQCGMEISFPETQFSAVCPMCGSTQVATAKQSAGIPPDGVIPFKIDKKDAQERFKAWVKSRWFAPNDFKKRYAEGGLAGMFLPFWTYDAYAISSYRGRGGNDRTVKDKDGKTKTVTDWYPTHGVVNASFDDIQICASQKEKNIEGILPYGTTTNTKPFSAGYLSGYYAEVYKIKADAGFESAKRIMESTLRRLAENDIMRKYDRADVQSLSTKYSNVTYKHVLLPLWSSAFGYSGKTYNYAINGETGKVSGSRPYSVVKIALAVLALAAAVAAFYVMSQ
ncbi:hypothetical protein AGMMS50276_08330 [Synergistales bacterium]|nr:hypothetical protein AGMMS50276_08330 [Synergistales bacterium]